MKAGTVLKLMLREVATTDGFRSPSAVIIVAASLVLYCLQASRPEPVIQLISMPSNTRDQDAQRHPNSSPDRQAPAHLAVQRSGRGGGSPQLPAALLARRQERAAIGQAQQQLPAVVQCLVQVLRRLAVQRVT